MTNVQIAIQDPGYARELQRLLVSDGNHRVHIVHRPLSAIDGVVVVDAGGMSDLENSEMTRCVVFIDSENFDANQFFNAGVRHLIHADCPPHLGRLVVLAAEQRLNAELTARPGPEDELREQLRDLKNALATAVWHSGEVARAMSVLNRSGHEVQVEIDAVLVGAIPRGDECVGILQEHPDSGGMSMFDATDKLFLQTLRISDR